MPGLYNQHELHGDWENEKNTLEGAAKRMVTLGVGVRCLKGLHVPGRMVFACSHVIEQDPERPSGIYFMPHRYYLCKSCYARYSMRKVNWQEVKTTCWQCVLDEVARVYARDPGLYKEFPAAEI